MINFTVGPVQMEEEIREIGAEEIPYFRTPEFSALMKENESLMTRFMKPVISQNSVSDSLRLRGHGGGGYQPFYPG